MKSPRILIIRIGALGDIFFALPAVSAIREVYPNAHITWLVGRQLLPILEKHPEIDRLVTLNEKKVFDSGKLSAIFEILSVLLKLNRKYDFIFLNHRDLRWRFAFRFLFGRLFQLGRPGKHASDFLVTPVRFSPVTTNESEQIQKLFTAAIPALQKAAWKISNKYWDAFPTTKSADLVVHLGGGQNTKTEFLLKQWPYWVNLVEKICLSSPGTIVLVGAPAERNAAEKIISNLLSGSDRIVNLVGKTSLPELVGVIKNAKMFIGVDSGPLHIADAAQIACFGIYGPTSPVSWGLTGLLSQTIFHSVPCAPCYKDDGYFPPCHFAHRCMTELTADRVFKIIFDRTKAQ